LYAKEKASISDKNYQLLKNCGLTMPSLRCIKKLRKQLNNKFEIIATEFGCYIDPLEKISFIFNLLKNRINIKDNIINVKLSGDGTLIAKNLNIFNFNFSLLDSDDKNWNTVEGNFSLGIFEVHSENYEIIKQSISEFIKKIEDLKYIKVDNVEYKINYYLAGDLKLLAMMLGIIMQMESFLVFGVLLQKRILVKAAVLIEKLKNKVLKKKDI
jgi:hypothetical protein